MIVVNGNFSKESIQFCSRFYGKAQRKQLLLIVYILRKLICLLVRQSVLANKNLLFVDRILPFYTFMVVCAGASKVNTQNDEENRRIKRDFRLLSSKVFQKHGFLKFGKLFKILTLSRLEILLLRRELHSADFSAAPQRIFHRVEAFAEDSAV